ncbi:PREDICTED: uncharacterized protein LOC107170824 [Diuraphis noxia]|uniref:uncharacterized protein LOC107170824 n=1 Tax=Diuraphis noxia TaxID=143948 RepID=UPI00076392F3|nr:PREDICTED: uncharacterized protein LOC107170824 [Diuraphis noxia]
MGVQNKQQQPFRLQPQQQKKRLYRCQVCSASFDTRSDCLEHIHKDHNQPQPSTTEERETEVTTVNETASALPHNISNSIENQQVVNNDDANHLTEDKGTMNSNTDLNMLLNDNIPDESSEVPVQEVQNIPENMSDQAEQLLQVTHEISVTNVDIGDMAIGGGETGTDHLDIESMLAAIHNDVSPPNDGGNPQNLL